MSAAVWGSLLEVALRSPFQAVRFDVHSGFALLCCVALAALQDVPLHVVCICEANCATQSLTRLLQDSLASVSRSLPPVKVPGASDAVKTARTSAGLNPKAPAGSEVLLQPLLYLSEVPKKPGVLETALDFGKTVVCFSRGMKDSVFAGLCNGVRGLHANLRPLRYVHAGVAGSVSRAAFRSTVDHVCGGPALAPLTTAAASAAATALGPRLSSITIAGREDFLAGAEGFSCMQPALVFVAQPLPGLLTPALDKCVFAQHLLEAVFKCCFARRVGRVPTAQAEDANVRYPAPLNSGRQAWVFVLLIVAVLRAF